MTEIVEQPAAVTSDPSVPGDDATGSSYGHVEPAHQRAEKRPYRLAVLVMLPYLLLSAVWIFSNPAGAAPDELDHLIKALGTAQLDIGEEAPPRPPPPTGLTPVQERNASITRVYVLPSRLSPVGFTCFAYRPDESAACLPDQRPDDVGDVPFVTPMGDYPPFVYAPIGWAAQQGDSPTEAFLLGRMAGLAMSWPLLVLACAQLVAWLGRRALLGLVWAVTPMAVFSTSILSTSGVEIAAAICVAAIVVAGIQRPESVAAASTQWTLAVAGGALVLSRHLGLVTLALLLLVLVVNVGWTRLRSLIGRPTPSLLTLAGVLGVSAAAIAWWELTYDTAEQLGPLVDPDALGRFVRDSYLSIASSIGRFGWFDTPLPNWATASWVALVVVAVGIALLMGSRRQALTILAVLAAAVVISFVTYSVVFFSVAGLLQGRQIMPLLVVVPMLAAGVVTRRLLDDRLFRRLTFTTAVVVAGGQFIALVWNARRYATGLDGPMWFFGSEEWSPRGGWWFWMVLALVGAALLYVVIVRVVGRAPDLSSEPELDELAVPAR